MRNSVVLVGAMLVASATVGGVPAKAADLYGGSLKDEPVYAPPAYTWTGFYFGGHAGYEWKSFKRTDWNDSWDGWHDPWNRESKSENGWIGGIQGGYNYQIGRAVLGTELSMSWGNVGGSHRCGSYYDARDGELSGLVYDNKCKQDQDWNFQWLNKLGVAFGGDNRWLAYAIGGLSATRIGVSRQHIHTEYGVGEVVGKDTWTTSGSDTAIGVVLGAGLQWAFTDNWSFGVEYLHAEYASLNIGSAERECFDGECGLSGAYGIHHVRPRSDTVRAVLNFKFK